MYSYQDEWATPFDYSSKDHGWVREEELPNLEATKDYIEGIVESLQENNQKKLRHCLEELCLQFNVKYKSTITR